MKSYGIIGHPLGHTMSPLLHNWGFEQHGVEAKYEAWPTKPENIRLFMESFRRTEVGGLSVTIPHKRAVMDHVDKLTARAETVGAVNTLWWDGEILMGDNTDVAGVLHPLETRGIKPGLALVLGAGGAARAAVAACIELGAGQVAVSNRTRSKAEEMAADFGIAVVDWDERHASRPELIINSTPLGMQGTMVDKSPWEGGFEGIKAVFDLVYNPLTTRLLADASEAGCEAIQGLEMFICQGLEQFRLWTGITLDSDRAREVLLRELAS